jgi:hypothetical protein
MKAMLELALIFLLVAIVAGLFGFGVIASAAAEIATGDLLDLRDPVWCLADRQPAHRAARDVNPGA